MADPWEPPPIIDGYVPILDPKEGYGLAETQKRMDLVGGAYRVQILGDMIIARPGGRSMREARCLMQLAKWLSDRAPAGFMVGLASAGIWKTVDGPWHQPAITVWQDDYHVDKASDKVMGTGTLIVEILAPYQQNDFFRKAIIARAEEYGVGWLLMIDPSTETYEWHRRGVQFENGPPWTKGFTYGCWKDNDET